jgi:hypothetical protein
MTRGDAALVLMDHIGDELEIPDGLLDDDLRDLVKRELLPLVDPRVHRKRIAPWRLASGGSGSDYCPLLRDLDGYAFAALYRPAKGLHECLYLPENVFDLAPWLLYAFKRWATELPEVFPSQPEWTSDPMWMTAEELSAQSIVLEKRGDAERLMADAGTAVDEAEASLARIRESVDASDRLLLTGTDTPLVDIVYETLDLFGFNVTNVDEELAEGQARRRICA